MFNNPQETIDLLSQGEIPMSQVSMSKGYWFYFKHNGNDISVHGSAWSGKEIVYLNNHPVSIKRNLTSFTGTHTFSKDGVNYRVEIIMTSILKARVVTQLYANDELVGTEALAMVPSKSDGKLEKSNWLNFIVVFAVFFAAGLALGFFGVSGITALFGS